MKKKGQAGEPRPVTPPELPDESTILPQPAILFADESWLSDLIVSDQTLTFETARNMTISRGILRQVPIANAILTSLKGTDLLLDRCDLANTQLGRSTLKRVELRHCRMTGVHFNDAEIRDGLFDDCKIDLAQFRIASFKDCRFEKCSLREADFYGADLTGVVFSGCDLTAAQFHGATLQGTDFRGSRLEAIQLEAKDLEGAIIDSVQAVGLAGDFARLLGLRIL